MRTWRALALKEISERRSLRVKLRMPERFMPQEGAAQRMQISSAYPPAHGPRSLRGLILTDNVFHCS